MIILFKVVVLAMLIQILLRTEKPGLCAGIYTFIVLVLNFLFGGSIINTLIVTAISGVLAFGYFWVLDRTRYTLMFWVIMVVGLALGVV